MRPKKGRSGTPGGKRTILLAGCAEVIKSRQIFSLSRRVSDTYIILKGLFRGHYTRDETSPSSIPIPSSRDGFGVLCVAPCRRVRKCVRGLSRAISPVRLHLASSFTHPASYCARPSPPFIIPLSSLRVDSPFLPLLSRGREGEILFTSVNATSVRCTRVSSPRVRHVGASRNPA